MRYSVRMLLIGFLLGVTSPAPGFEQANPQLRNAIDQTAAKPGTTEEHEIGPKQTLMFVNHSTVFLVYFTIEPTGLRVVTEVKNTDGVPVRFVSTLAADQTAIISLPGDAGNYSTEVSFIPRDARLVVRTID